MTAPTGDPRFGVNFAFTKADMGISLCMIVKNEQDWVAGAVESVRSIVDEVIIVDTGSTDSTLSIVHGLGVKVLEREWPESFAEARNISLAAATQPWILVLDADERIAPRDLTYIKDAAAAPTADGFHLVQRNYVYSRRVFDWTPNAGQYPEGDGYQGYVDNPLIRFFRNSPEIRFHGVVHEIVDPARTPRLKFAGLPAVIHHYGKVRGEDRVAQKQRHYLELGLKKTKKDPRNAKAFFDLGIQHQELNQHAEAAKAFESAFAMGHPAIALLYRAISEKHLRNYDQAASLLQKAIKGGIDEFNVRLELGNVRLAQDDLHAAQSEYTRCLELEPRNPIVLFNRGLIYRKLNDAGRAIRFYEQALKLDPGFREPKIELATLHLQANRPAAALETMQGLGDADARVLSLKGVAQLQLNNLDEAQKHLEAALRKDRTLNDARLNLAQVYMRKGDHARAARYVQSVVTK